MKYLWTTIIVNDMDASVAFYTEVAGLKVQSRFPAGPGVEIAFLGNGTDNETLVELMTDDRHSAPSYGKSISIGFAVDSAAAMLDSATSKGIPVYSGPVETPAYKFFGVQDPSGLHVQFFEKK